MSTGIDADEGNEQIDKIVADEEMKAPRVMGVEEDKFLQELAIKSNMVPERNSIKHTEMLCDLYNEYLREEI